MSFWAIKSGARHSAADLESIKLAKSAIEEAKRSLEDAHAATRSLTAPVPTESGEASKASLQRIASASDIQRLPETAAKLSPGFFAGMAAGMR